jgi:CheY-like chemotaxis protein
MRFEVEVQADCPAADLDPQAFSQLLLNLLLNARDAGGPRGLIRLEVGRAEPPAKPLLRWSSSNRIGWVRVRVRDDGAGVPSSIRERLFEPFFTTKPAGHGLGLAAVARIAEAHGAVLDAPILPGRGAIFDVYLPIASRPMLAPSMRKDPDAGGTERLWVVDDDEAVREYLVAALLAFGYEVRGFSGPLEVLKAVDGGEGYELLVTDLSMPEMDGVELHLALRGRGIRRPVLFCSGYSERASTVPSGRDVDFMQKPLSMRALAQRVRRLLNYTLPGAIAEAG